MGLDFEAEAIDIHEEAGVDPHDVTPVLKLAILLLGAENVVLNSSRLPRGIPAAYYQESDELHVRAGYSAAYSAFLIAHELAERHLSIIGYVGSNAQRERAADRLAAHILMSRPAFQGALRETGCDFTAIARRFMVTETMAALRFGEVVGHPVAVVDLPSRKVMRRGPLFRWGFILEKTIACVPLILPAGITRYILSDVPGRVAFVADQIVASSEVYS
jgi:hypothetical protein